MLQQNDNYCKIITDDPERRKESFKAIEWIGTQAAERLLDEPVLEVRKYQSGLAGMDHCAVVMCNKRVLWNIPRKILKGIKDL